MWYFAVYRIDEDSKRVGILSLRHERTDPRTLLDDVAVALSGGFP